MSRGSRAAAVVVGGLLLAAATAPVASVAAYAHDALVDSDPAPQSTVAELNDIALTFSADPIDEDGADIVQVVGPDGRYYETACPSLAGPVVSSPVALGAAGEYTVQWKIVSSDGHPVSGDFAFTYDPTGAETGAPGSAEPACGRAEESGDAASAAAESGDDGLGLGIGIAIGAVVIVGVGIGAWLLIRRPHSEP